MANPINLNKARKAKARISAKRLADQNAAKFGRTGAQKKRDGAEVTRLKAHIDAHKRDD